MHDHADIRAAVAALCSGFPGEYWRGLEPDGYPGEFVAALTAGGWLSVLIPEQFGGAGLGLDEASAVLEEINASGGNAAACPSSVMAAPTAALRPRPQLATGPRISAREGLR